MNEIAWRDSGIVFSIIGLTLLLAVVLSEVWLQSTTGRNDSIFIQVDSGSESDDAENIESNNILTIDENLLVSEITEQLGGGGKVSDWKSARSRFPQASPSVWIEASRYLYDQELYDASSMVCSGLLLTGESARTLSVSEKQREFCLFQLARIHSIMDRNREAITSYQQLLQINPTHQIALINLGLVLRRENRNTEAIDVLTRAAATSSGSTRAKALAAKGESLMATGDFVAAQASFEQSILYRPQHAPTFRKLAEAKMAAGREAEDVLRSLDLAISLRKNYPQAQLDRARYLWRTGDTTRTRRELEALLKSESDFRAANWTALHFYNHTGRTRQAREMLALLQEGANESDLLFLDALGSWIAEDARLTLSKLAGLPAPSTDPWVHYYRGHALHATGDKTNAHRVINALFADPWLGEIGRVQASRWYRSARNYEQAEQLLMELRQRFPRSPVYATELGELLLDAGKYNAAIEMLSLASNLTSENRPARLQLARAYDRNGQPDLALSTYEALLRDSPANTTALFESGMLLERLGRYTEAETQLRGVLQLDSEHPTARFQLSGILQKQRRLQDSANLLIELLEEKANDIPARERLVALYREMEQWPLALAEVERLLALRPNERTYRLTRARILMSQGDLQQATATLIPLLGNGTEDRTAVTAQLREAADMAAAAGDHRLAAECYELLLGVDAGDPQLQARLLTQLNLMSRYTQTLEIAARLTPPAKTDTAGRIAVQRQVAVAHYHLAQHESFVRLVEPLLQGIPASDELRRFYRLSRQEMEARAAAAATEVTVQ